MLKFRLSILLFLFAVPALKAQDSAKVTAASNSYRNTVLFCFNYGRQVPVGILSNRFGGSNTVGFATAYKLGKNYQVQAGINAIFSGKVKENGIFDTMVGGTGYLVDVNGNLAEIKMYERGITWHVDFGKVISTSKFDINSGILLTAGAGFMQHYIKYTFQRTVLPQLEGEYAKGYDRLTNGLMLRGFAGYQRIDPKAMLNFVAGIEVLNGLTKNRRAFNFDTRTADNTSRNDLMIGIKVGVMISISGRKAGTSKGDEERYFD